MVNSLSVFLWGQEKSGIRHVISGKGRSVGMHTDRVTWVCSYDSAMYYGEGSNSPDDPDPGATIDVATNETVNTFLQ